jgi:hypothetical protein
MVAHMNHPPDLEHLARQALIDRIRYAWNAEPVTAAMNAGEFADALGIPRSTFNAKIRGLRPNGGGRHARDFRPAEIDAIADLCGVDRWWLATGLRTPARPR